LKGPVLRPEKGEKKNEGKSLGEKEKLMGGGKPDNAHNQEGSAKNKGRIGLVQIGEDQTPRIDALSELRSKLSENSEEKKNDAGRTRPRTTKYSGGGGGGTRKRRYKKKQRGAKLARTKKNLFYNRRKLKKNWGEGLPKKTEKTSTGSSTKTEIG